MVGWHRTIGMGGKRQTIRSGCTCSNEQPPSTTPVSIRVTVTTVAAECIPIATRVPWITATAVPATRLAWSVPRAVAVLRSSDGASTRTQSVAQWQLNWPISPARISPA